MKVVTFWHTLMKLAKEVGEAKRSRDPERTRKAEEEHDAYKQLCLESDEMAIGGLNKR